MRRKRSTVFAARLAGALVGDAVLVTLYFLLPLHDFVAGSALLRLVVIVVLLLVVVAWQLRSIVNSRHPGARAVQALAVAVPLLLLLFASTYVVLASTTPTSFNPAHLTRSDALYFTVSTFATVGYGDITPASQAARLVVTGQILLDLLTVGVGIRVFVFAVRRGQSRQPTGDGDGTP
jgi:voltage-gated potassium channel Kch